jgi:hypothetical protein
VAREPNATTFRIGERVCVALHAVTPQQTNAAVLALGEDRHRVLNPDLVYDVPWESGQALACRASDDVRDLGSVVARRSGRRLVLDVVVYDLDASPMVRAESVERGLDALLSTLEAQGISRIAMEPIGLLHRGLGAEQFTALLRVACARASCELEIALCHPDGGVLDEIAAHLGTLH